MTCPTCQGYGYIKTGSGDDACLECASNQYSCSSSSIVESARHLLEQGFKLCQIAKKLDVGYDELKARCDTAGVFDLVDRDYG